MVEAFTSLWEALKSGELQAILAALALVGVAIAPVWSKITSYKLGQWKARFEGKKEESVKAIEQLSIANREVKSILVEVNTFVEEMRDVTSKTKELWDYVLEHSTLTEAEKAYAKETYTSAIKLAKRIDLSAIEIEKAEELPVQAPTEEITQETPVGL